MNAQHRLGVRGLGREAFTLIEIMVVVAIMGIVMAAGIPSLMSALRKEGLRKAVNDVTEICEKARAQAIMNGRTMQVHFHPQEGTMSVEAGSSVVAAESGEATPSGGSTAGASSAKLPDSIAFEMLDVNLIEYNAADDAVVRFFPNGRCDEMVAVLVSDKGERRALTLEITTGLVTLYDDPRKLLR